VKRAGYPWTDVGPGPEPRLPADFAAGVIDKARTIRARQRRAKIGTGVAAGIAAMLAIVLWMRAIAANQPTLANDSSVVAPLASNYVDANAWTDEPDDLVTVLMPNARPVEKFDSYYATASWDTYASWDPEAYDASRSR
jgi:hypothetical protein